MAVRKTNGTMQKTLNDLKQERDVLAQAIEQLQSVLNVLSGGTGKKRGRPKKTVAKLAKPAKPAKRAKVAKVAKVGKKKTKAAKKAVGVNGVKRGPGRPRKIR